MQQLHLERAHQIASGVQAGKGEVVEEMGQLLEKAGMRDVLPLPKARVPVVKFVVADTNTKVDFACSYLASLKTCSCSRE